MLQQPLGGQVLVQEPQRWDVVLALPPQPRELLRPPEPVVERQHRRVRQPAAGRERRARLPPRRAAPAPPARESATRARRTGRAARGVASAGSQNAARDVRERLRPPPDREDLVRRRRTGRGPPPRAVRPPRTAPPAPTPPRGARAAWPASAPAGRATGSAAARPAPARGLRNPREAPAHCAPAGAGYRGVESLGGLADDQPPARQRQRRGPDHDSGPRRGPVRPLRPRSPDPLHAPGRRRAVAGDTGQQRHRRRQPASPSSSTTGRELAWRHHDPARLRRSVGAGARASGWPTPTTTRCGWAPTGSTAPPARRVAGLPRPPRRPA